MSTHRPHRLWPSLNPPNLPPGERDDALNRPTLQQLQQSWLESVLLAAGIVLAELILKIAQPGCLLLQVSAGLCPVCGSSGLPVAWEEATVWKRRKTKDVGLWRHSRGLKFCLCVFLALFALDSHSTLAQKAKSRKHA